MTFADDAMRLADLRMERADLDKKINNLQSKLIQYMQARGLERSVVKRTTITIVSPVKRFVDEQGLRKELDESTWTLITHRVYDENRAQVAIEDGVLALDVLERHTRYKPGASYLKITRG